MLETLYDSWQRFKDLLKRFPHHGLLIWLQMQRFYNGLNSIIRQMIDAAVGGTLNTKTSEATQELFQEIAMNSYQ